jgi:ATP-dependent RNA helicase HelY
MVLNLLLSHTSDQIEGLLEKSFAAWIIMKKEKKKTARTVKYSKKKIQMDFIKHLNFLKSNGFVSTSGLLTEDGIWAAKLRVDQPLVIAEGFRLGVFPVSDPALLAAVMASFVNEKESDDRISSRFLSEELIAAFSMIKKALKPFSGRLVKNGFEVRPLFLRPCVTIYAWATGCLWDEVLSVGEIAEGDLVMLVLRTADNLRHIRGLSKIFPESSRTASEAIALIMKDPVISGLSG